MSIFTVAQIIDKPRPSERARVASTFGAESLTFGELQVRSESVAAGLREAGFRQGDRLGALMQNRLEWLEIFFAVARLGGVLVPLNHLLTPHELGYILDDSGARWLLAEDAAWGKVDGLPADTRERVTAISVGAPQPESIPYGQLAESPRLGEAPAIDGDDLLLLQYTSGTTGSPKGAMHTHATVLWNAISQRQQFSIDETTVYLCLPALSWVAGFHSLHLETLWSGGRSVLNPTDRSFDPVEFCRLVERERITTFACVPTVLRRVLGVDDLDRYDLSSLRTAVLGGEPVPVHLLEEMTARLPHMAGIQAYGMSEFPSLVTLLEPEFAASKLGSAGRANPASQVRVVDGEGADCAPGTIGEILTRSPANMVGYYGKSEETARVLRGGWFHTGDLGYIDEDGFLYISGRSKDVIISGGLNIYPAEIEDVLSRHEAVAEVAVIPVADDKWGEIARAVVVLEDGATVEEGELREYVEPFLARFKIPKSWKISHGPPLPRTPSGKLQKFKIIEAEQRESAVAGRKD